MSDKTYDLVIIGAGPGGYVAAIRAAQLGLRVACIEKEKNLGGTCLRVGCIPSKALLDSSELYAQAKQKFSTHGIVVDNISLDLKKMLKRKEKVVKTLTGGVASLLKKNKVERLQGTAKIISPNCVEVLNDTSSRLNTTSILVASGSVPAELPFLPFDGERIVCSTEALSFSTVPSRLIVIGAGPIGLELGSVWSRLGSQVLVVEAMERIVAGADVELSTQLQKVLEKQGIEFKLGASVKAATVGDKDVSIEIALASGETVTETADRILVAVGRKPYTDGLGLEDIGVICDERGCINVNDQFQTTVPGIYAIGDVVSGPMLAHKAEEEGLACAEIIAGQVSQVNYQAIPSVVYTWPELASVGLTEEQALEDYEEIASGRFPFMANGRARAADDCDGLVKIITDKKTDRIIGVHILGARASDLIAEATIVMEFGGSAEDIARTCHAHPTFSETIKEAALDVAGRVIHK
ncbi:uncharacterized protein LOC132564772 [Ylistrum balloti]|uniref:uncharacterized protein LOC132564772 n=1 Tax=Ylistrum balloti TaxID=509963 RepID=UPI0029059187|nr:uncharacterized protein LOC132564772 [Ylistrum balloti]